MRTRCHHRITEVAQFRQDLMCYQEVERKWETAEKADFKCGPHIGSIFSGSSAYLNRNRLALKFLTCLMRWKQHLSHRFCKRCIFDWAEIKDLPRSVESHSAELDERKERKSAARRRKWRRLDGLVIAAQSTGRVPNGQVSVPDQGVAVATNIKFARISKTSIEVPRSFVQDLVSSFATCDKYPAG